MLSVDDAGVSQRAAVASARTLDAQIRKAIRKSVGATIVEAARREAVSRASTPLQRAVARTARASFWQDIPGVAFGGRRAVASSGVPGRVVAHGAEYGSEGTRRATFRVHSPDGTPYSVTRRTSAQFRPRHADGAFAADAALAIAEDVVDEWTALVVDAYVEAVS